MVKATQNTPDALLEVLKAGNAYSGLDPAIHDIRITRNGIEVDCSSVGTATVQGKGSLRSGGNLGRRSDRIEDFKSAG